MVPAPAVWIAPLPFILNIAGWMLTENGRQPWIVQGLQLAKDGVSPSVGTATIVTSIIVFFLLYGDPRHRGHGADDPLRPKTAHRRRSPTPTSRPASREFIY